MVNTTFSHGSEKKVKLKYNLTASSDQPGSAKVIIRKNNILKIKIKDANPHTLYTVWIDFKNRESGLLTADYPLSEGAEPRGVAPAMATTQGVTEGMGMDKNGVVTDENGDAVFRVKLDYDLLKIGDSPVVADPLSMQGLNRVGGSWLRTYPVNPVIEASLQEVDPRTGLPILQRATAQGITIVGHPDLITHGLTPGISGVDQFSAFKGDFPEEVLE